MPVGAFGAEISSAAAEQAQAERVVAAPQIKRRRWFQNRWVQLAGLVLLTPAMIGGVGVALENRHTHDVTAQELDSIHPPRGPVGGPTVVDAAGRARVSDDPVASAVRLGGMTGTARQRRLSSAAAARRPWRKSHARW